MKLVFAKKFSFLSRTLLIIISFLLRLWKMEFFSQKKGLLFYLEHDFSSYFDREQIEKKIAFFYQSKGKSLLKMLILGLYCQTLFCNQDHHQTLFLVVFWGGTKKEKFKFSYKNYGFTPLEKCDFSDIKNCFVYSHFLSAASSSTSRSRIFTKNKQRKIWIYGSKSWVNPFGKI